MKIPLAGKASRRNGAVMDDDQLRIEHQFPARGTKPAVKRRFPKACFKEIAMLHDRRTIVDCVVRGNLVRFPSLDRRCEG